MPLNSREKYYFTEMLRCLKDVVSAHHRAQNWEGQSDALKRCAVLLNEMEASDDKELDE